MTVALAPSFRRSIAAGNARRQARPAIYYIRHGLTDWNVAQRLQGRHDVPLNAAGCAQAACCAAILQDLFRREGRAPESFDYVSSPLVRARATMEIVRAALGLEPAGYAIAGQLAEIAFGEWEGLTYAQVMARDKQVIAARESDKWSFAPPGGTKVHLSRSRAASACGARARTSRNVSPSHSPKLISRSLGSTR